MASGTYPAKIDPSTSSPGHMHRELRHASFDVSKGTFIETVQLMHKDNAIYCFISCYIYADTKNQEHVAPKQSRSGRSTAKKIMNSQPIYAANFSSPSHRVSFTSLLNPFTRLDNTSFCSAARFRLHCHMICFVGIWDNDSVHPHVPSSHMYSISDMHLTENMLNSCL